MLLLEMLSISFMSHENRVGKDFARIVEIFDNNDVSFVSVTQALSAFQNAEDLFVRAMPKCRKYRASRPLR